MEAIASVKCFQHRQKVYRIFNALANAVLCCKNNVHQSRVAERRDHCREGALKVDLFEVKCTSGQEDRGGQIGGLTVGSGESVPRCEICLQHKTQKTNHKARLVAW